MVPLDSLLILSERPAAIPIHDDGNVPQSAARYYGLQSALIHRLTRSDQTSMAAILDLHHLLLFLFQELVDLRHVLISYLLHRLLRLPKIIL